MIQYKINSIKDLNLKDKSDEYSLQRIGKIGYFMFTPDVGSFILFLYDGDSGKAMSSSKINKLYENDNLLHIKTVNTIYEFECMGVR